MAVGSEAQEIGQGSSSLKDVRSEVSLSSFFSDFPDLYLRFLYCCAPQTVYEEVLSALDTAFIVFEWNSIFEWIFLIYLNTERYVECLA